MQQQQLMQMQQHQPMMSSSAYYPNNVTTDHIQQYLDENKSLILKIVDSQNSGNMSECAENQARLQQNLMYLAAIADSEPNPPSLQTHFAASTGVMQQGSMYMQHLQAQQIMPSQSTMIAARSSMLYDTLQQQQMIVQDQLGMNSGFNVLQGNDSQRYSDFGCESGRGVGQSGDERAGQHSGGKSCSDGI